LHNGEHLADGSGTFGLIQDFAFWDTLSVGAQQVLADFQTEEGDESYVWTSPDGTSFGPAQANVANIAVVSNPTVGSRTVLPNGYNALLAQGDASVILTDGDHGNALIVGNLGHDSIFGIAAGDTLVGATDANSWFWSDAAATILGGGNDTVYTGQSACSVSTASGHRSVVVVGASANTITLNGIYDTLGADGGTLASDTVTASNGATIFAPSSGKLVFDGGDSADLVAGQGGAIQMYGGSGNGSILWAGASSNVVYFGGAGSAIVVGGSGPLDVNCGTGLVTVYGGTSDSNLINGAPGGDEFVVGYGPTTVNAASGNVTWLVGLSNNRLIANSSSSGIIFWGVNSGGNNVFQAPSGPNCGRTTMHGGSGNDTLIGGSGPTTMAGGGGDNVFEFINGSAGGADVITDFSVSQDVIQLYGYGGYTDSVENGSEILMLSDGTRVELAGIASLNGVIIHVN
jgi:Ca2+-binding RTX toxin-like protein